MIPILKDQEMCSTVGILVLVCSFTRAETLHSWDVITETLLTRSWCFALESPDCPLLESWWSLLVCRCWGIHCIHFLIWNRAFMMNWHQRSTGNASSETQEAIHCKSSFHSYGSSGSSFPLSSDVLISLSLIHFLHTALSGQLLLLRN